MPSTSNRFDKAREDTVHPTVMQVSVRDQHITEINFMRNQNVKVGCIGSGWVAGFCCK